MKIYVTQEDIDNGNRSACFSCPIALALKRECVRSLGVSKGVIFYSDPSFIANMIEVPLPEIAIEFIRKYDSSQPVEPFEFEIDIPF